MVWSGVECRYGLPYCTILHHAPASTRSRLAAFGLPPPFCGSLQDTFALTAIREDPLLPARKRCPSCCAVLHTSQAV